MEHTEVPQDFKETKTTQHNEKALKKKDITKCKTVQYWLEGLAKATKRNYLKYFPKWLEHTKEVFGTDNPDKLIEMRKQDLKSDDMKERMRFEHIAKVWYHELYDKYEKEGLSTGHALNHLKTVMSFFSRNHMKLEYRRGELKQPKKKIKRIQIDIEDLKTAYTMLDVRDKAIFTTLLQSGLSEIDVCNLRIEHIIDELDKPPVYIEGYREKTTTRFQSCLGQDACVSIKKYLILRGNPKEGLLFVTKFHTPKKPSPMTPRAIRDALSPVERVIPDFKPKMLRDVFHDALERANIKEALATRMFGHKLSGAKGEYLFASKTVKIAYQKAYVFLQINDVTREYAREKSTNELIIRLGEIVSVMATQGQQAALWKMTELINELKGTETPDTYYRKLKSSEIQKEFNEAIRMYLKSV